MDKILRKKGEEGKEKSPNSLKGDGKNCQISTGDGRNP